MSYAITTAQRLGIPTFSSPKNSRFFASSRKGESFELKSDLNSEYKDKRRDAVKRVIANMTVGKDMSALFADVLKCMHTDDLPLKKLVYLYLINHAKTQPELVILAVNTFVKDVDDPNPHIRALAIRTMGCLKADKILDYLVDPLRKGLSDEDAYVRKTAAICVAKLFDLNPKATVENGFITKLQEMLTDPNPMVVANSVTALADIKDASGDPDIFVINGPILHKMMTALNECTEWGQTIVLETLASYEPSSTSEAEQIVEKVLPRLSHKSSAVTMTAIRLLLVYMDKINDTDMKKQITKKVSPPLVSIMNQIPELAYLALRNIKILLNKDEAMLNLDLRLFFCQYTDPPYVKMEKMDLIAGLTSDQNVDQVLSELKEYANDVDVDFSRKAIKVIGSIAVRMETASERCVNALLDLVKSKSWNEEEGQPAPAGAGEPGLKASHVVQEAVTVIKNIFRKYPNRFEAVIPILCDHMDQLDEPSPKAALIWIVGEYAERIEDTREILQQVFEDTFKEEHPQVQSAILTAMVKMYLKGDGGAEETQLVKTVLQTATKYVENPDIRDRAFVYLRLLAIDPMTAKQIVLARKPPFSVDSRTLSDPLVKELIKHIGCLASVYHEVPTKFVSSDKRGAGIIGLQQDDDDDEAEDAPNLLDLDFGDASQDKAKEKGKKKDAQVKQKPVIDLLGGIGDEVDSTSSSPMPTRTNQHGGIHHSSSGSDTASMVRPRATVEKIVYVDQEHGEGMEVLGAIEKIDGTIYMELDFVNYTQVPMSEFGVQFNKNAFGLAPAELLDIEEILPDGRRRVSLPLNQLTEMSQVTAAAHLFEVAVKNNVGVYYFRIQLVDLSMFIETRGRKERWWAEKDGDMDLEGCVEKKMVGIQDVTKLNGKVDMVKASNEQLMAVIELSTPHPVVFLIDGKHSGSSTAGVDLLFDDLGGSDQSGWNLRIRCASAHGSYMEFVEGSLRNWLR